MKGTKEGLIREAWKSTEFKEKNKGLTIVLPREIFNPLLPTSENHLSASP